MRRTARLVCTIIVTCALAACADSCLSRKTHEVRAMLNTEIKLGDSRDQVEYVLKNAHFVYGFDQFQNLYQANVYTSECGSYQAVSIYVHFDSEGKVMKVEVFESYTAP